MTIAELIAALKKYPKGQCVVVDGYEGGFSDPVLRVEDVALGVEKDYEGEHSTPGYSSKEAGVVPTSCLVVGRFKPT